MRLAGSSLLYSRLSLADACERLRDAGFDAVDLACQEGWAHVDPSAVVADPKASLETIRQASTNEGVTPVALNADCGDVPLDIEAERVGALAGLADALGVPVMTLPAAPADGDLDTDLDRFRTLVDASANHDVTLTVETHWGTHTADPSVAARYAESVPGLGYTLDPGHYAANDTLATDAWASLLPAVEHVHLRQAGSGWKAIQLHPDDGRLDFTAVVSTLRDAGYDGTVTVEYIDSLDSVDSATAEEQATALADRLHELL